MKTFDKLENGDVVWVYRKRPNRKEDSFEQAYVINLLKTESDGQEKLGIALFLLNTQQTLCYTIHEGLSRAIFRMLATSNNWYIVTDENMLKLMKYLPYYPEIKEIKKQGFFFKIWEKIKKYRF